MNCAIRSWPGSKKSIPGLRRQLEIYSLPDPGQQPALIFARKFMLPDAEDTPALRTQCARHPPVAGLIAGYFIPPECCIAFRIMPVLGASMPETTIDKYGQFLAWESEVRTSSQLGFTPPTNQPICPKQY